MSDNSRSRVVVIGATGHVGGYLIPRLVGAGYEVVTISRGHRRPYRDDPAWAEVASVTADREAEDAAGTFGRRVADLQPDIVIDMVCFTEDSAAQLVDAIRGRAHLLVHCGTIWVHGPAVTVPVTEDAVRTPFGEYGVGKAEIEQLLQAETRSGGVASIVLHPGHISGPGWPIINPAANLDLDVWHRLATGAEVVLPNFGLETIHHVHADDVAQAFELAASGPAVAIGNSYHVVSPNALTLRGFAESVATWFGREANLRYEPYDRYAELTGPEQARATWEHIARSPSMSIAAAERDLGYRPRYSSLAAVAEAVAWLADDGQLDLGPDGRRLLAAVLAAEAAKPPVTMA